MTVRLSARPLAISAAMRELEGPGLGGVVLFAGRVRPDARTGGPVRAILYEADPVPAVRQLASIAATARRRFGAGRVVVWHRVGRVPAGAPSVLVGAACAHRAEAFAAARYLIETLKVSAPIWKTELTPRARPPPPPRARRAGRSTGSGRARRRP